MKVTLVLDEEMPREFVASSDCESTAELVEEAKRAMMSWVTANVDRSDEADQCNAMAPEPQAQPLSRIDAAQRDLVAAQRQVDEAKENVRAANRVERLAHAALEAAFRAAHLAQREMQAAVEEAARR